MGNRIRPNKNSHFQLVNAIGTTDLPRCRCRNWMAHWRNHTGSSRVYCAVLDCTNEALVGAHVVSTDGRRDKEIWIAPLCSWHNHRSRMGVFFVDARSWLVHADPMDTCRYLER